MRRLPAITLLLILTSQPILMSIGGDGPPAAGLQPAAPSAGGSAPALPAPRAEGGEAIRGASDEYFTENAGQLPGDLVRLYSSDGSAWFTDDGAWHRLPTAGGGGYVLKQEFVGCGRVRPEGEDTLDTLSHFIRGKDPKGWRTDVPSHGEVWYRGVWDGIDVRYHRSDGGLKYDIVVGPGADPADIAMDWKGADRLEVDSCGGLVVATPAGELREGAPLIYQERPEGRVLLEGRFVLLGGTRYSFVIDDEYYRGLPLTIDPPVYSELKYGTYLGGNGEEKGYGIDVDDAGNAYVCGLSRSSTYPTTPGAYDTSYEGGKDVVVTKLGRDGASPLFSTYIGGGDDEEGWDLELDGNGDAYITGYTKSNDFPTIVGSYDLSLAGNKDVFVLKLGSAGSSLGFSTYVGAGDEDWGQGVSLTPSGAVYVAGWTKSTTFPTTSGAIDTTHNGNKDAFLIQLDPAGSSLQYSTFLGGSDEEKCYDVCSDEDGHAYITGQTKSGNYPTTSGAYDTTHNNGKDWFVTKIDTSASAPLYSTFIGGGDNEEAFAVCVDAQENAYVTGYTKDGFPATGDAFDGSYNGREDLGLVKLNPQGSALLYSTYIGGNDSKERGYDIGLDPEGNVLIAGFTKSNDFPTTPTAYQGSLQGGEDGCIIQFDTSLSKLRYSSYFGGADDQDFLEGVAVDGAGDLLLVGWTRSDDAPVVGGSYDTTFNGDKDIIVSKFSIPLVRVKDVSLVRTDGQEQRAPLYARYSPYTFRVNVSDGLDLNDLDAVSLTLDPQGEAVELQWTRSTGQFQKLNDPEGHLTLMGTSGAANDSWHLWTMDFDVLVNWTYPDEKWHDVEVSWTSAQLPDGSHARSGLYRVENDLEFAGELAVTGEGNRTLSDGDVVRARGNLSWKGLTPVYQGASRLNPPAGEFGVNVTEEWGGLWESFPDPGAPINMTTVIPNATYVDGDLHRVRIFGIPPECDASDVGFLVRVDGDNVTFTEPDPGPDTWLKERTVTAGITVADVGGSGVNGSSVMYSVSSDDGVTWTEWLDLGYPDADVIRAEADLVLEEGDANLLRWRARDAVGNGPNSSQPFRMKLDTREVEFAHPLPASGFAHNVTGVPCFITITDSASGVDPGAVEYSMKAHGAGGWSQWRSAGLEEGGREVRAAVNATFADGEENHIRWRAKDMAGNGWTVSDSYRIRVDSRNVTFGEASPGPGTWLTSGSVACAVTITDRGFAGVNGSTIAYRTSADGGSTWGNWTVAGTPGVNGSLTASSIVPLPDGPDNMVQWRAWDDLGNGPSFSAPRTIPVDTTDVVFPEELPWELRVPGTPLVSMTINVTDAASGVDASSVEYAVSTDGGETWSSWNDAPFGIADGPLVSVQMELMFPEGDGNLIRFRAADVAGNGPAGSAEYPIPIERDVTVIPQAGLLLPGDETSLSNTSVKLVWDLFTPDALNVTYDVYLDTDDPPESIYAANISADNVTVLGLVPRVAYYWTVVPRKEGLVGDCLNGPWSFTILEGAEYGIEVSRIEDITVRQGGEPVSVEVELENLGSVTDRFRMAVIAGNLTPYISIKQDAEVKLEPGEVAILTITVSAGNGSQLGDNFATFLGKSLGAEGSGLRSVDSESFLVKVVGEDWVDPGSPGGGGDGGGEGDDEVKSDHTGIPRTAILLLIILVLLMVLLVVWRARTSKEAAEAREEGKDGGDGKEDGELGAEKEGEKDAEADGVGKGRGAVEAGEPGKAVEIELMDPEAGPKPMQKSVGGMSSTGGLRGGSKTLMLPKGKGGGKPGIQVAPGKIAPSGAPEKTGPSGAAGKPGASVEPKGSGPRPRLKPAPVEGGAQ